MIEKNKNKVMIMYVMINAIQATNFNFTFYDIFHRRFGNKVLIITIVF
jgi:hypothetical protein